MSDVRLSNASPVERVDARQQDNVRPSVRRNLFGRPDPDEIRRDAETSEREEVQRFRETYDFDLVEGRPLAPRSYDWVQDDDAPEFYSRQPHSRPRGSPGDSNRLDNDGGERPSVSAQITQHAIYAPCSGGPSLFGALGEHSLWRPPPPHTHTHTQRLPNSHHNSSYNENRTNQQLTMTN
uniref:Cyclin-dependent kinase inhibitor 1B n=1 Tax=Oreochromis niloticus TaxID=8128 RepID=A0A669C579_ORENI